jgi:hypothetical protein
VLDDTAVTEAHIAGVDASDSHPIVNGVRPWIASPARSPISITRPFERRQSKGLEADPRNRLHARHPPPLRNAQQRSSARSKRGLRLKAKPPPQGVTIASDLTSLAIWNGATCALGT